MPIDRYEEADEGPTKKAKFREFDCPSCNANNPCDPPFGAGDEVLCYYCGLRFAVKLSDGGRLIFREF